MPRSLIKFLSAQIAAVCAVVAFFCPWGFLCAFEPGQEMWLFIYPVVFVMAVAAGLVSAFVAARV